VRRAIAAAVILAAGRTAVAYRGRVFALEGGPQPGFAFSHAVEALRVP
jgi:hypothetical protein